MFGRIEPFVLKNFELLTIYSESLGPTEHEKIGLSSRGVDNFPGSGPGFLKKVVRI